MRRCLMTTIVFPGQGAQHKGMGSELFDEYKELCMIADKILGYSIKDLCINDPEKCLNLTQFTQVALYTVNALCYYHQQKSNSKPRILAGHSLGEYNALLAAGVFDFETGLKLVQKRGQLMSKATNGGMLAIVRSSEQQIKTILQKHQLSNIDIANYNTPSQLVLSGTLEDITTAKSFFDAEKVFCIPLKVSGAFHSRHMQSAAKEYQDFLNDFEFKPLKIPVIANVTGLPYEDRQIKEMLVRQLSGSVQWTNTVRYLQALNQSDIIEIGPGKVLSKLNADIIKNAEPLIIEIPRTQLISQTPATVLQDEVFEAQQLGSRQFLLDHNVKYPYIAGSMCNGISSAQLVVRMANSGFLAFLGSTGLSIKEIEALIKACKNKLTHNQKYGVNIDYWAGDLSFQKQLIDLCLKHNVPSIEVSGFDHVSFDLVKYRAQGLLKNGGQITIKNRILLKTSQSKTAVAFMQAAPVHILDKLLSEKTISQSEYELCKLIPMADDICVEGDSAWRTDQAVTMIKLPEIIQLRNKYSASLNQSNKVRIGSSGGVGTPEAMAAVFTLGADFVLTGSINQCTVEAAVSDHVKGILQTVKADDTSCVPAGDLFESGAKVRVLSKGSFFPARAQKLYDLYRLHGSLDAISSNMRQQLEKHFFGRSIETVYQELKQTADVSAIAQAEENSKYKMAMIFKWYFEHAKKLAIKGREREQNNYQIYCGPALGAFNQWVAGGPLEKWQNRHVDDIAKHLLESANLFLNPETLAA